jgi:hypothetical protein
MFDYWIQQKERYETNLKNGVGHKESILALLTKIDQKLSDIAEHNGTLSIQINLSKKDE